MKKLSCLLSASFLGMLIVAALLAPWLPIKAPAAQDLSRQFLSPAVGTWLGTGENGVDIFSQIIWGARISLGIGLASVTMSGLLGLLLGVSAGFLRGSWDFLLMRVVDVVYAFPGLLLAVALAAFLGPNPRNLLIALVATSWAGYARLVRAQAMQLREREFVVSAKALGAPNWHVIARHVVPNLAPLLLVQMTFGLASTILTESSLSFLGLGAAPGTPSWGQLLNAGREFMTHAPHLILAPGAVLVLTVLAFNVLGEVLRDTLDPQR